MFFFFLTFCNSHKISQEPLTTIKVQCILWICNQTHIYHFVAVTMASQFPVYQDTADASKRMQLHTL